MLKSPYGRRGHPPNIPGDTDLIFEISLLKVDGNIIDEIGEGGDPSLYSASQRIAIVKKLNKKANEIYE